MIELDQVFLAKAEESLAGAESEYVSGRYNNCANRCYYVCFQAAICALGRAGVRPSGDRAQWSHAFVQAHFAGQLVHRRKLYPATLRDVLNDNLVVRRRADYELQQVSPTQATRALRRTRELLGAIRQ